MQDEVPLKSSRSKLPPRGWLRAHRVRSFNAPKKGKFRRILRFLVNGWTISVALLLFLAVFLTVTCYWFEFCDRIDRKLLSGAVYTPTAGIYSAPKILRSCESVSMLGLIDYLN